MGEAALVIVTALGGLVAFQHIVKGQGRAVGELGVLININGIGLHILGDLIAVAEDRNHLIFPVHGEEALVHQGEERTVGEVVALIGVQGPVGVVGQGQGLEVLGGGGGDFAVLGGQCAAVGHVFPVLRHAAAEAQGQTQGKQSCNDALHSAFPPQTMTAPWLPRSPLVTRWDQ